VEVREAAEERSPDELGEGVGGHDAAHEEWRGVVLVQEEREERQYDGEAQDFDKHEDEEKQLGGPRQLRLLLLGLSSSLVLQSQVWVATRSSGFSHGGRRKRRGRTRGQGTSPHMIHMLLGVLR